MQIHTQQKSNQNNLEIPENSIGQRLDNFLFSHYKHVPKSRLYRGIRNGELRINGGRVKACYRIKENDLLRVPPQFVTTGHLTNNVVNNVKHNRSKSYWEQELSKRILYEDKYLLIVNKPFNLAVHGGSGINLGLIENLRNLRPELVNLQLIHRLDRDTSGCIMLAKRRSILVKLHEMLRMRHGIEKKYHALLQGKVQRQVICNHALRKVIHKDGQRKVICASDGLASQTIISPLQHFDAVTLVEAIPVTGRTHQIRVHAASLQHAIAGDDKYGNVSFNETMKAIGLNRLFLHASSVQFTCPITNKEISVFAPYCNVLTDVLKRLN